MTAEDPITKPPAPDADQVIAYLMRNPGFLEAHPELIPFLLPPKQHYEGSVADIQHFMVKSLQGDVRAYAEKLEQLVMFCREILSVQEQVHEAALRLLEVNSLHDLVDVVHTDLTMLFDVDDSALCLQADIASEEGGVIYAPANLMREWTLGKSWLGYDIEIALTLFPHSGESLESLVLLPMQIDAQRQGILAFGSRDAERFTPDMGTELLGFLSQVLARRLKACL